MQIISDIAVNALLFASLLLVVGVPVLYATQK
ncbi:MAG TPA: photosystem II reaction center protein PsbZ, partial [Prochlorococcus sp.]